MTARRLSKLQREILLELRYCEIDRSEYRRNSDIFKWNKTKKAFYGHFEKYKTAIEQYKRSIRSQDTRIILMLLFEKPTSSQIKSFYRSLKLLEQKKFITINKKGLSPEHKEKYFQIDLTDTGRKLSDFLLLTTKS